MEANSNNKENWSSEIVPTTREPLWIFGYGSLCWNPGFEFKQSVTGYVKGFSRRFWQGNTTHRGTENKPGRVATLIEDTDGITWGRVFLLSAGDKAALPYLKGRECCLGGYRTCRVPFYPRPDLFAETTVSTISTNANRALLYIALPENRHWLGAAPLPDIAKQIIECQGPSGPNAEYLLKLADFMRQEIPEALDDHLFSLERLVRKFAAERMLCLRSLMGETVTGVQPEPPEPQKQEEKVPPATFQYATRLPEKKLRCVNM